MKTKQAAEFKKGDRVQIKAEILKERGYAPSKEVGIVAEGPYNNPKVGPNTYTVTWRGQVMKLSDASELEAAPEPREMNATSMAHDSLEREIKKIEKAIRGDIDSLRRDLDEATRRLDEGNTPNSCGIVQGRGLDIDMKVCRLDQARQTIAQLKAPPPTTATTEDADMDIKDTIKTLQGLHEAETDTGNAKEANAIAEAISRLRTMKEDLVAAADEFDDLVGADLISAGDIKAIRARLRKSITHAGGR